MKSCISTGPNGPAVTLFWLSETGMPLSVVSVGRLATDYSCVARHYGPGGAAHAFATSSRRIAAARPGVIGNVCIRFAMSLARLLQLLRFCANLRKRNLISWRDPGMERNLEP